MTDTISNKFHGSVKVTCKEAVVMLNADLVDKAIFRPDGVISRENPDDDEAFVWYREGVSHEM